MVCALRVNTYTEHALCAYATPQGISYKSPSGTYVHVAGSIPEREAGPAKNGKAVVGKAGADEAAVGLSG